MITERELGQRIRDAREARGLTQQQLADQLEIHRSSLAQLELGNRSVTSLELERLARLLGRHIGDFFQEAEWNRDPFEALLRGEPELGQAHDLVEELGRIRRLALERAQLERMLSLRSSLPAPPAYKQPSPRTTYEAVEQGERIAEAERRRLGLGGEPIPDVAELLENEGVRVLAADLPGDVSGLAVRDSEAGCLVAVDGKEPWRRRRFSLAHELAHLLLDSEAASVSLRSQRKDSREVRANAFAAAFLMPREGMSQAIEALGKGKPGRLEVYDGEDAVEARDRSGHRGLTLFDVTQVAHHFAVSREAALYRLHNLGLLSRRGLEDLLGQERSGRGRKIERLLDLEEPGDRSRAGEAFRLRFLGLAVEAFRREEISRAKLLELARMVDVSSEDLEDLLGDLLDLELSREDARLPPESPGG